MDSYDEFQNFVIEYVDQTGVTIRDIVDSYLSLSRADKNRGMSWLRDLATHKWPSDWPEEVRRLYKSRYNRVLQVLSSQPNRNTIGYPGVGLDGRGPY